VLLFCLLYIIIVCLSIFNIDTAEVRNSEVRSTVRSLKARVLVCCVVVDVYKTHILSLKQKIRRPFAKFLDSPCYSESEICGGAVTASFFEEPPLASDALFTPLHPLLENVLQTVDHFEISCLRAPFTWVEKPRNLMGRDLN
jgi:hypothetical protein